MSFKNLCKIAFCLILLFTGDVFAQPATTTSLGGTISKFYGEVVRNAAVTIKLISKKDTFTRTTVSDATGKYQFPGISPGSYEISVTDRNGSTYENSSFKVPANQTTRLDIKIEYGGDCLNPGGDSIVLTEKDRAGIVNEILREVLLKGDIAEFGRLKGQPAGIVLASENIKAEWIKPLKRAKINLLGSDEIRKKAEAGGELLYLSFGEFKIKGGCVVASITNMWASPVNSRKPPVSGGGRIFVYGKKGSKKRKLKTSGRWTF